MNLLASVVLSAVLVTSVCAQDNDRPRIDPASIPEAGKHPADFVPTGWRIEEEIRGDLNRDKADDLVLDLIEDLPVENAEGMPNRRNRAVIVLVQKSTGYSRVAVAGSLLYCTTCGGMLSDPSGNGGMLRIEKGVLIADQLSGSREMTSVVQRFRFDAATGRMILIGQDVTTTDRLDGSYTSRSDNYLTGRSVTEQYVTDKRTETQKRVKKKITRIAKLKRTIEEIDYNVER